MSKHIGYLIKNLNDKIKAKADSDLKEHGITLSQSKVLRFLARQGKTSTQKEIERFLEISHPSVVGIISRMVRGGYITCKVCENDRRNKIVSLTDKAEKLLEKICLQIEKNEMKMTKGLSDEDVEHLKNILGIIYKNIEDETEEKKA